MALFVITIASDLSNILPHSLAIILSFFSLTIGQIRYLGGVDPSVISHKDVNSIFVYSVAILSLFLPSLMCLLLPSFFISF